MKKILFVFLFINIYNNAFSSTKEKIINNLLNTNNFSFNFEQNINSKIETGNCIIEYPKKIFCKYDLKNNKILISNGTSIVIKTDNGSYYRYGIKSTIFNYILDKKFLIDQIKTHKERIIDDKFINFTILKDENEINIFFDTKNYNLIGWQTLDVYQNLNITYLTSFKKNLNLQKNIFVLPPNN